MHCINPVRLNRVEHRRALQVVTEQGLIVPCGKCIACRKAKAREWTLRMLHELDCSDDACFLTLTYDDDNLPVSPNTGFASLRKRDAQLFFKRLRRNLPGLRLRYFLCGEYGDSTLRPHYHAIVYNLRPFHYAAVMRAWDYCDWSVPAIAGKSFAPVNVSNIAYVAGYVLKKYSGPLADEMYAELDREPVFRLMSKGIGRDYCDANSELITAQGSCRLNGNRVSLPRYYVKRLGIDTSIYDDDSIDRESLLVEQHTGVYASEQSMRDNLEFELRRSHERLLDSERRQRERILYARELRRRSVL